ncbi:MAG: hypothetical protein GY756_01055 [bacterium]|nr:hypothetical protein [bacterium]
MKNENRVIEKYPFIVLIILICFMSIALFLHIVFLDKVSPLYYFSLKIGGCIASIILIQYFFRKKKYYYCIFFLAIIYIAFPYLKFGFSMIHWFIGVEVVSILILLYLCYRYFPQTDHDKYYKKYKIAIDKK